MNADAITIQAVLQILAGLNFDADFRDQCARLWRLSHARSAWTENERARLLLLFASAMLAANRLEKRGADSALLTAEESAGGFMIPLGLDSEDWPAVLDEDRRKFPAPSDAH